MDASMGMVDGHIPNYHNPETRIPELLGVQISFTLVAVAVVVLRLGTRKYLHNGLTVEDWFAAASLVTCLASTLCSCFGILGGTGLHYYDVHPGVDKSIAAATSYATQVLYQPTLQLARLSILLFYLSNLGKQVRTACIALICLSTLFLIACTVVEFLQCHPVYMLWTGARPEGYKCIKQSLFFCITAIINLVFEILILGVPIPVIWQLGLPKRTKFALCGIFSVGCITIAAQIVRLVLWFATAFNDGNRQSKDASWNRVTMVNWSCIEYTTAVTCASLPHLKALVSTILPGIFDSVVRSRISNRRSEPYAPNSQKLDASRSTGTRSTRHRSRSARPKSMVLDLNPLRRSIQQQSLRSPGGKSSTYASTYGYSPRTPVFERAMPLHPESPGAQSEHHVIFENVPPRAIVDGTEFELQEEVYSPSRRSSARHSSENAHSSEISLQWPLQGVKTTDSRRGLRGT